MHLGSLTKLPTVALQVTSCEYPFACFVLYTSFLPPNFPIAALRPAAMIARIMLKTVGRVFAFGTCDATQSILQALGVGVGNKRLARQEE